MKAFFLTGPRPRHIPITGIISLIPTILPMTAGAWDSPLPSLSQPAGTDLGAFSNPAAATRPDDAGTGFSLAHPDSGESPWKRSWGAHHQENGQAVGLRLWEGGAKTEGEIGWTAGTDATPWLSTGARLAWRYRESARDRLGTDAGFQVRPHPVFLAGYWGENLWSTGSVTRLHRGALAARPFAGAANRFKEFSLGYGLDFPEEGARSEYLYVQTPLPFSASAHAKWDWNRREASLGISVQATAQMVAAWGLSGPRGKISDWGLPGHREAAVRFYKARKPQHLAGIGKVAEIDLNHAFAEGETQKALFGGGTGEVGFLELLRRIDAIEAERGVKAVVIRLGRARAGWGMGEEIRGRLLGLRKGGRRLVAYLEQATPLNYYLATAADVVAMQPGGHFAVTGFSNEVMFYKGFFDKLGVEPQFLRHGRFKSFEEPYTRKEMSPESRANLSSFLGSIGDHFVDAVAEGRGLPRDSVVKSLAAGDINLDFALRAGLIDTLIDQDQVLELAGGKHAAFSRIGPDPLRHGDWEIPPRIALIVVSGDMVMGHSSKGWLGTPELAGARSVAAQLKRARLDPDVKAVVIRVESPGGSAQAADIMSREVDLIREAGKPVVASIGHVAASGGYYLVCGADRIFSAHNSAVGSIGILWGKFVLKGLYGKLGLTTETVKTAPHADASSLSRAWDTTEVAVLQRHMDGFYDRFTSKVAAGRKLTKEAVDSLAQGRIFTGSQAVANRLVDSLGGLADAVREASRLAGIPEDRRVDLDPVEGRQGLGFGGLGLSQGGPREPAAFEGLAAMARRFEEMAEAQLWALSPELSGWTAGGSR